MKRDRLDKWRLDNRTDFILWGKMSLCLLDCKSVDCNFKL